MPIEFRCQQCGQLLRTPDETAGQSAKCPACGAVREVPKAEPIDAELGDQPTEPGEYQDPNFGQQANYANDYQNAPGFDPYAAPNQQNILPHFLTNGPGLALIILGLLGLVISCIGLTRVLIFNEMADLAQFEADVEKISQFNFTVEPEMFRTATIISNGFSILLNLILIYGGIQMRALRGFGWAMAASIIAVIPCFSPCCFIGVPIGIWALITLSNPLVKMGFQQQANRPFNHPQY
jgi:phage FluMu protein Com